MNQGQAGAWREVGHHWLKFNTVGAIGIGVQLAALAALKSGLELNYLLATGLAVEAAVLHNFVWPGGAHRASLAMCACSG